VSYTQDLFSSRNNSANGTAYIGQVGRLWYDPNTNTLRVGNGNPGGQVVTTGATNPFDQDLNTYNDVTFANLHITGNLLIDNQANVDLGNLYILDQTIHGSITNRDITLEPAGSGTIVVPNLQVGIDSLTATIVSQQIGTVIFVTDYNFANCVTYSTAPGQTIAANTYGVHSAITAPWAVINLQELNSSILLNDGIACPGLPPANVVVVGSGIYNHLIVADKTFASVLDIPPANVTVGLARPSTNNSLDISTAANTNIFLNPQGLSQVDVAGDIVPYDNNLYNLGNPLRRWKNLYLGPNTIFMQDPSTGVDLNLGALNGNLAITGVAGMTVGQFVIRDNEIYLTNPSNEIVIGQLGATGNLVIRKPLNVVNSSGESRLTTNNQGQVEIFYPNTVPGPESVLSVIGSSTGNVQPRNFNGTLLHLTAQDNEPARLSLDAFGANVTTGQNAYALVAGRSARGNVDVPQQTLLGDTLMRFTVQGYSNANAYVSSIARINLNALENFTPARSGTEIQFQTTPIGANVISTAANITSTGLSLVRAGSGIKYTDGSFQTTAFTSSSAVTSLTAGGGIAVSSPTGNITVDNTGIYGVNGTPNQVLVTANVGQVVTLGLPQDLGPNSTVTFGNITVGNLTVLGNTFQVIPAQTVGTILYLGNTANTVAAIDGGGIVLGNINSGISRSILYSQTSDTWVVNGIGTGITTNNLFAANINANNAVFDGFVHVGAAAMLLGLDYPNASLQVDTSVNGYSQIISQNHFQGANASVDFVAVSNNGDDTKNFIDMGINSNVYSNSDYTIGLGNDGYLYVNGGNLSLGTQSDKYIVFHAGGTRSNNRIGYANTTGFYLDTARVTNLIANTRNISEDTNVYFTAARARGNVSAAGNTTVGGNLQYNSTTGVFSYSTPANVSYFVNDSLYTNVAQMTANVNALNTAIVTANTDMKTYVDAVTTAWTANAAYQAGQIAGANAAIITANTAMKAYVDAQTNTYSNVNVAAYLPTYTGNLSPGNITVSRRTTLGNVGNVSITGGTANYALVTDGAGNLNWGNASSISGAVVGTIAPWTPTLYATGGGSFTYSVQNGTYLKNGNSVHCFFTIQITNVAGVSGTIRVEGLPVAAYATAPGAAGGGQLDNYSFAVLPSSITGLVPSGSQYMDLYWHDRTGSTNTINLMTTAQLGTTATLVGRVTYISAT